MSEEDINGMFSMLPDYSEKVTKYQVGHIKKKGYNVPSCATVMTYGLCCAVCRIGSPLNWHTLDDGRKKTIRERGA
jgi:DNA primase large subunit